MTPTSHPKIHAKMIGVDNAHRRLGRGRDRLLGWASVCGSKPNFTNDCCQGLQAFVHRGGRHPLAAHTGAVVASRQLHSNAQAGVARQNSLRALLALRSNNRREFDHEARCARRPRPCASRRPRDRPHRVPTAASAKGGGLPGSFEVNPAPRDDVCKDASEAVAARLGSAETRRSQGRARQRASLSDSAWLLERSARRARSEFRDWP